MTKTKILTILASVLLSTTLFGQAKTTKELTDKFFEAFSKSPTSAIEWAFAPTCKTKMQERAKALTLQAENLKAGGSYGWYIGNEQVLETAEGSSVKIASFVVKYDCRPVKIKFILYKAKNDWTIADLYIDPDFEKQ